MSPISKKYKKSNTLTLARFDQTMGAPILLGILFFFVVCLGASDSIKKTVMVVAVFALLVIAVRFKELRERIHWPFIALTLYVIMDGVSTFYAVSGKFALREFLKVFLAYLLAVILLATSPKKEEITGKRIATILAVCTAFGSLVSIDLISTRWISGAVIKILELFSQEYEKLNPTTGTRITSLFSNSNVFAGFSGLGVLLSFGLTVHAHSKKERMLSWLILYINSLAFILSFSIGATFFFGLSVLAFFILEKDENFAVMQLTLIITLLLVATSSTVIFLTSLTKSGNGFRIVPLICILLGAGLLCCIDGIIEKLARQIKLPKRKYTLLAVIVVIVVLFFGAWKWTASINIAEKTTVKRALYLEPGSYELDIQTDGKYPFLTVESQNRMEAMFNSSTRLYRGSSENAIFTVPEDSMVVYFSFTSVDSGGNRILSAKCGNQAIPLRYVLLPEFVASRLQGVFAHPDSIQRLVFFDDGLKLFRRSPAIGLGIGAFENAIKSVQSYYYETKYVHNHYFQTMLETGIVGLFLFLFLLLSSAIAIWKSRKEQLFAPMLGAVWLFMAGQAVHDIVFSSYAYLPVAYGCFIMIDLCCGEHFPKPKLTKTVKTVSLGLIAACTAVYCGFLAGNLMAKRNVDNNPTMETLKQSVELDRFEWADYALPYVINATGSNVNIYVRQQADEYAERLAQVNSNTIPIYLAEYFFDSDRMEQGIAMVEKYVDYVASDPKAWQSAFQLLRAYDDGSEVFHSGVIHLAEKLDAWNADNIGTITLDETAMAYIESCKT